MKFVLTIISCLLMGLQNVSAQYSKYTELNLGIIVKNRITALVLSGRESGLSGSAWGPTIEIARFNLAQTNKVELVTALNKALSWATINNAKKLSFQKRVARVDSYFNMDEFKNHIDNSTRYMNVVFVGKADGSHSVVLYKGYYSMQGAVDEFYIEQPSDLFWKFDSDQQIRELITKLEKQNTDLDEIFK